MSARPARAVRVKLAGVAWAAALVAMGLGPASAMAENERPTTNITLHNASGILGIGAGEKAHSKAGHDLLALHCEYQAYLQRADAQGRGPSGFRSRNFMAPTAAGYVSIDTAAAGDAEILAADLEALGLEGGAVFGRMVSGTLPVSAIPALAALDSLKFAHLAYAMTLAGAVTSQGDAAIRADIARSTLGVDGTGVAVGVLSDSFNCIGGAAAGVASGDLPTAITVLEEGPCDVSGFGSTDEGRALAEVVHDVAPAAGIAFHTTQGGQASFAQGIIELANFGAKVITDDVIYFAEPMFQDGIIAQAVDLVKARGVSYFSAAGNDGRKSYESPFRGSGLFLDLGEGPEQFHDFDPGPGIDVCQRITLPVAQPLAVVFQWDQPFFSVSGPPGSQSDLDIQFTDAACTTILGSSLAFNVGNDPFEFISFQNDGPATTFGLRILKFTGPAPGLMKTVLLDLSRLAQVAINEFDTQSPASYGHFNALGGLGVGATRYQRTPAFGTTPPVPVIAAFSSAGGVPILFDTAGNRLPVPQIRQQPALVAPSGVNTTFFHSTDVEGISDVDGDGFPNFFGTSAAAPHAAGVAALLKDLNPLASPDEIYNVLKAAAIDMDDPATPGFDTGFDFGTGFGLIRADVTFGPPPGPPPFEVEPAGDRPRLTCRNPARCRVPVACNLAQIAGNCGNPIEVLVPSRALRTAGEALVKGPRQMIQFGASVTNVPPSTTGNVRLTLPKRIRNFVRKTQKKSIRGVMQIRSAGGTAIETRRIKIRLK